MPATKTDNQPIVSVQTTADPEGTVTARTWIYEYDDGYRDALDVLSPEWKNVPSAQRLNEMNARHARHRDLIDNPPAPEPVDPNQALLDAQTALQQAQDTISTLLASSEATPVEE